MNLRGVVKEIKVFESVSPQGQNWFHLHLRLEAAVVKIRRGLGIEMASAVGSWGLD